MSILLTTFWKRKTHIVDEELILKEETIFKVPTINTIIFEQSLARQPRYALYFLVQSPRRNVSEESVVSMKRFIYFVY